MLTSLMTLLKSKTQQQENDYNVFFNAILLHGVIKIYKNLPFQHISNCCKNNNNVDDDDDDCKTLSRKIS